MKLAPFRWSDRVAVGVVAVLFGLNGVQSLIDQSWIVAGVSCAIAGVAVAALIRDHRRN